MANESFYSEGGPRNSFFPSGKVTSRPAIRLDPSLEAHPVMETASVTFRMSLVQPVRRRIFGGWPSTIIVVTLPDSLLESTVRYTCGLVHSIFVTTPLIETGFLPSYSAANE